MKALTETVKIELENMVDAYGFTAVLESLAEIAGEKADHIAINWQDQKTAVQWNRVALAVLACAGTAHERLG